MNFQYNKTGFIPWSDSPIKSPQCTITIFQIFLSLNQNVVYFKFPQLYIVLEYLAIITHANFKVYLEVDPNYHEGSSLNRFVWEEVGEVGFHFLLLLIRSAKPEKVERPEPLFRTGSSAEEERGCSGGHDVSSGPNI